MILRTNDKEIKRIVEMLIMEGFIINSVVGSNGIGTPKEDKEIVLQKDNIQINLHDLKYNGVE